MLTHSFEQNGTYIVRVNFRGSFEIDYGYWLCMHYITGWFAFLKFHTSDLSTIEDAFKIRLHAQQISKNAYYFSIENTTRLANVSNVYATHEKFSYSIYALAMMTELNDFTWNGFGRITSFSVVCINFNMCDGGAIMSTICWRKKNKKKKMSKSLSTSRRIVIIMRKSSSSSSSFRPMMWLLDARVLFTCAKYVL